MRINIATWDRLIRFVIGVLLVSYGLAGGPVWAFVGLVFICTAAWRFDPFYALFRTGTLRD